MIAGGTLRGCSGQEDDDADERVKLKDAGSNDECVGELELERGVVSA